MITGLLAADRVMPWGLITNQSALRCPSLWGRNEVPIDRESQPSSKLLTSSLCRLDDDELLAIDRLPSRAQEAKQRRLRDATSRAMHY